MKRILTNANMTKQIVTCMVAMVLAAGSMAAGVVTVDTENRTITKDGKTYKLYGKVKIVDSFEDIKVKIVDCFEDVDIKIVDAFEDSCCKVRIVDSFEDVKVKIVDSFEDVKVKIVEHLKKKKK